MVRLRKEMGKPTRREAAGLRSLRKLFVDFEQIGVSLCGGHGGPQLCLSYTFLLVYLALCFTEPFLSHNGSHELST